MKLNAVDLWQLVFIAVGISSNIGLASAELPNKRLPRTFSETGKVSVAPVYGVMKNWNRHVATVHGFVDNLEICKEIVGLLNKEESRDSGWFSCAKM